MPPSIAVSHDGAFPAQCAQMRAVLFTLENLDLCLPDKNFSLKDQVRSDNKQVRKNLAYPLGLARLVQYS